MMQRTEPPQAGWCETCPNEFVQAGCTGGFLVRQPPTRLSFRALFISYCIIHQYSHRLQLKIGQAAPNPFKRSKQKMI
jgi:hypothetical protein